MIERLSTAQLESILDSTARLNIWEGPVRSGKTVGSLVRFAEECVTGPPGEFIVGGRTKDTIRRNVVGPLTEMLGPGSIRYNQGLGELRIGNRLCYALGANDVRAEEKVRGVTLAGGYIDEITILPESFWKMVLSRLSVPGAKLFGTTNPDAPSHWLNKGYLKRAGELNLKVFSNFRLEDNPGLDSDYVESLKAEYGPPGSVWYQRYILGRWVLAEGAIWSAFDRKKHLFSDLPKEGVVDWWVAVDYGTTNPFVALLVAEGRDGKLYVVREWRWDSRKEHRQLTDQEYSKKAREWLAAGADGANHLGEGPILPNRWIVDPSAASFSVQLYRDGARVWPGNNTVSDGLRWVNTLFGADRLRIHESCVDLIDEIEGYVWDPKALDRGEEQPLKQDDHGPDALRYHVATMRRIWGRWVGVPVGEG